MPSLLALGVALFLPPDVADAVVLLSQALEDPDGEFLRLGPSRPPHITLTQQFVNVDDVPVALAGMDAVLADVPPLSIDLLGGLLEDRTVWLAVARTPAIVSLHEQLMAVLRPYERRGGTVEAFAARDGRARDIRWVDGYREVASFAGFTPHITLGHAPEAPQVERSSFTATTVAACRLGRFCTCGAVLRRWSLTPADRVSPRLAARPDR